MEYFRRFGHHPHESAEHRAAFGNHRAKRDQLRGAVRDAQIGTVDHIAISPRCRRRVARRYQSRRVEVTAQQRRKRLWSAAGLDGLNVLARVHAEPLQRLDDEVMRVAAESSDADFLTLEIFGALNIRLAKQAVSQDVFDTSDKN